MYIYIHPFISIHMCMYPCVHTYNIFTHLQIHTCQKACQFRGPKAGNPHHSQ